VHVHSFRRWLAVLVTATVAGCQTYEPHPLDLPAHVASWSQRAPESETVRAVAERLAAADASETTFDPADGLTLDEATIVALVYNADLRVERLRAGVSVASAGHAGRWNDPEAFAEVQRIVENVPEQWIVFTGLSITFPTSGALEAEQARADGAAEADRQRVAEHEWALRGTLRDGWTEWSVLRMRIEETERLIAQLESIVASTRRLAEAGEISRPEAGLFEIELTSRRMDLRRLEGDALAHEQRLRALLGLTPEAPVTFMPGLAAAPPPMSSTNARQRAADANPTLVRLAADYEVAELTLHREIRKQYPDLTIGPSYQYEDGRSRVGFVSGLPLPIFNANVRGIAEARAERDVARAAYETAYERVAGQLAGDFIRLGTLQIQRRESEATLVPLVDDQVDDARRLLAIGEGDGLVLLESLLRAHDTKMRLLDLHHDEARTASNITQHIGPMAPAAPASNESTP
jgi:outer membrane protein TolC